MKAAELLGLVAMGERGKEVLGYVRSDQVAAIVWSTEMGERLRQLRGKLSLAKLDAATDKVGTRVSRQYIHQLEKGEISSVDFGIVRALCEALEVSLSELLAFATIETPSYLLTPDTRTEETGK